MSSFKRFLLLGSIGVFLLAGLMFASHDQVSRTAFASGCNTVAKGSWSNNCTVSEGNISEFVYAIQVIIAETAYPCTLSVDGNFGPQTFAAVECFQGKHGLAKDGIVGPKTWGALQSALQYRNTANGWKYYYLFDPNEFEQSQSTTIWYVLNGDTLHWCQMNLGSPC